MQKNNRLSTGRLWVQLPSGASCRCSSAVERHVANVEVASAILVTCFQCGHSLGVKHGVAIAGTRVRISVAASSRV